MGLQTRAAAERLERRRAASILTEADYALKTLARETGAQAFFPTQTVELKGIYASIAAELANQYSIGYVPASGAGRRAVPAGRGSAWCRGPELRPRTRLGYTARSRQAGEARPPC